MGPVTTTAHEQPRDEDVPNAVHAMVLFGQTKLYLSHMPLFSPPHNDQVILEVTLSKPGENPEERYRGDRGVTGTPFYTVKPPAMCLSTLQPGASFVGDVHRKSYGDGGELLLAGITVTVSNVVYAQQLDPTTTDDTGSLNYLCFGEPGELFAAHQITSPPSFAQILSLTILDESVASQPMRRACVMIVPAADDVFSRLQPHDAPKAGFVIHPGTRGEHTVRSRITVGDEIYFDHRLLTG
jgi:hypothetical protein